MSLSERNRPPSLPSTASLNHTTSRASRRPPPPLAKVVTVPPWARDEPPSPTEDDLPSPLHDNHPHHQQQQVTSDTVSLQTDPDGPSRWWSFTLPRVSGRDHYSDLRSNSPSSQRPVRPHRARGFREKSISWLQTSTAHRDSSLPRREKDASTVGDNISNPIANLPLPLTAAHTQTPGWDLPWSARLDAQGPHARYSNDNSSLSDVEEQSSVRDEPTGWPARRKQIRSFFLTNAYIPLLFRFINISFTTAALAMAIHIRKIELTTSTMGAVGSSPTVVIIFAPLTLLHVMAAIYLEYFGRPLGLWRTSGKLAHTLSEVLFICAWSASLSLCFDNFFTSPIPCTSPSSMSWYNELERPKSNLPVLDGPAGKDICKSQLALICLVGVGLIAYCMNLVISLYRVFEKVKYHPPVTYPSRRTS